MHKPNLTQPEMEINAKDNHWGWFSVWKSNNNINNNKQLLSVDSTEKQSSNTATDNEFEVVQQDNEYASKSYTASYDHMLLENNLEHKINDQYVNLNEYGVNFVKPIDDDDDEKPQNENENENDNNRINNNNECNNSENNNENNNENVIQNEDHEPVMISQTLTLKTRNEELEKERDELHSETLQLRMETQCLRQTNEHIIAAQQKEIEKLQCNNEELKTSLNNKINELKQFQQQIDSLKRERDNFKTKLHDICYNRLQNNIAQNVNVNVNVNNDTTSDNAVLISDKHIIYGCIQCGQHLFDSSALIQRQIEIDDNTFGLIVDGLIGNNNDTTMGPTVCKTFLNGMFKVKEVFCDGCLSTFGWKISQSFDEWNEFYLNKYCVDISTIKQISIN